MTEYTIISFDPGKATGIATGKFSDTEPLTLMDATIVDYDLWPGVWVLLEGAEEFDHVTSEHFTLRQGNEFTADLHSVKVEGTLELLYGTTGIAYRERDTKSQVPDDLLREIGWWKTGADVDWEDGRDANDAIIHMLGHVAFDLNHLPTLRAYFK